MMHSELTRSAWVMAISVAVAIFGGFGLYLAGSRIDSVTLGLRWSLCFAGLGFILNLLVGRPHRLSITLVAGALMFACWLPAMHSAAILLKDAEQAGVTVSIDLLSFGNFPRLLTFYWGVLASLLVAAIWRVRTQLAN